MGENIIRLVGEELAISFQSEAAERFAARAVSCPCITNHNYSSHFIVGTLVSGHLIVSLVKNHDWSGHAGIEWNYFLYVFDEEKGAITQVEFRAVRSKWDERGDLTKFWFTGVESIGKDGSTFVVGMKGRSNFLLHIPEGKKLSLTYDQRNRAFVFIDQNTKEVFPL